MPKNEKKMSHKSSWINPFVIVTSIFCLAADHNRVHATDVLHGVYYLLTQAIPGFQHVNPDGDVFHNKQVSSSESGESSGANNSHAVYHSHYEHTMSK